MRDNLKVFLDSNVVIYAYRNDENAKQQISKQLIAEQGVVISTQVLQEMANTLHRKFKADYNIIRSLLTECLQNVTKLHINTQHTILKACNIADRYHFSFYDSLIIAAAIESECSILYSEDMQHNMKIENQLTIFNPFIQPIR